MSNNIKQLRETHDMTQAELAKRLGVQVPAVSKWERDLAYPRMDKLVQMAQIFGCSTDTVLGLKKVGGAVREEGYHA